MKTLHLTFKEANAIGAYLGRLPAAAAFLARRETGLAFAPASPGDECPSPDNAARWDLTVSDELEPFVDALVATLGWEEYTPPQEAEAHTLFAALTKAEFSQVAGTRDFVLLQMRGQDRIPADNPKLARLADALGTSVLTWFDRLA